jgi:hypothetical protein
MVSSLFNQGQTLPSLIANGFIESPDPLANLPTLGQAWYCL